MNINYAQGIVILIVLVCVLHTNYAKAEKSLTKSDHRLEISPSNLSSKKNENSSKDQKYNGLVEQMLLKIATIIQSCIDERTMNNKKFKIKLDNLYKNIVKKKIQKSINKHMAKVIKIKKQYEKDVKILKIMNSEKNNKNSKIKDKPSKKSGKE